MLKDQSNKMEGGMVSTVLPQCLAHAELDGVQSDPYPKGMELTINGVSQNCGIAVSNESADSITPASNVTNQRVKHPADEMLKVDPSIYNWLALLVFIICMGCLSVAVYAFLSRLTSL